MSLKLIYTVLITAFLFSLASAQAPEKKEGDLKFEPFTIPFEGQNVNAELGRLVVRENRSNPKTSLIELAFVRLKSTAEKPGYPVVYLDGGPGSSAINTARAPDYMRAFMKLREVGDVILLDQRGVGRSKPNLSRLATASLPVDVFANNDSALRAYKERTLNRVVLIGTEGPDHTNKLPFTSDESLKRLARRAAAAPELQGKVPDLVSMLKEVMTRFEDETAAHSITTRRLSKPTKCAELFVTALTL